MPHILGVDISRKWVRVALVHAGYRRVTFEAASEQPLSDFPSVTEALHATVASLGMRTDSISMTMDGDKVFIRRIELPATAQRQIAEVLPFELEAHLPLEIEGTVFDSHILSRSTGTSPLDVLAVVARTEQVQAQIDIARAALKSEPERIEPSTFAIANLASITPELLAPGPILIIHLDTDLTDVLVMRKGQAEFGRTLSLGTDGLPGTAKELARDLRQTLIAYRALGGEEPAQAYLAGPGAELPGAEVYLSTELGLPMPTLPKPRFETTAGVAPDAVRFARALGAALGLLPRAKGFTLRRGSLSYERGYGFLREKIPLLSGLAGLIVASFIFSTWIESHAISKQKEMYGAALEQVTASVFGEKTRDPQRALDLVNPARSAADEDPMPQMDDFDLMVQLAKAVPPDVKHDIEELDMQKGHATIKGIVPSIPDAQQIATTLQGIPCFKNVKIVSTVKAVNEDRQKYTLALDVKCSPEVEKDKKSSPKEVASSEGKPTHPGETP